jgi:hypothetical protein
VDAITAIAHSCTRCFAVLAEHRRAPLPARSPAAEERARSSHREWSKHGRSEAWDGEGRERPTTACAKSLSQALRAGEGGS